MNKWKTTFIFLTGFMLHEVMAHMWLGFEGLLPLTSKMFFGLTITSELNAMIIVINGALLLICAYLGFLHNWGHSAHVERHA